MNFTKSIFQLPLFKSDREDQAPDTRHVDLPRSGQPSPLPSPRTDPLSGQRSPRHVVDPPRSGQRSPRIAASTGGPELPRIVIPNIRRHPNTPSMSPRVAPSPPKSPRMPKSPRGQVTISTASAPVMTTHVAPNTPTLTPVPTISPNSSPALAVQDQQMYTLQMNREDFEKRLQSLSTNENENLAPEQLIINKLAKISLNETVQFKYLAKHLLSLHFQERLLLNDERLTISNIPVAIFIILRVLVKTTSIGSSTSSEIPLFFVDTVTKLPGVIQNNVEQTETPKMLVLYLNMLAVLFAVFNSATNTTATKDQISITLKCINNHLEIISNTKQTNSESPHEIILQVFSMVYVKILQSIVNKIHAYIMLNILGENPLSGGSRAPKEITDIIFKFLKYFQQIGVVPLVVQQFFGHFFKFLDAIFFNEIILRKELCSFSCAFQLKMILEEALMILRETKEWFGEFHSWLPCTQQIITSLTIDKKLLCDPEIRSQICPDVSVVQLKQMCSLYESAEGEHTMLSDITRSLIRDSKYKATDSLLLEINSVILTTNNLHFLQLKDLGSISFSKALANLAVKELKKKKIGS